MGQFFSSASHHPCAGLLRDKEVRSSSETVTEHKLHPTANNLSILARAKGHYWYPDDGDKILDACGGAGVACIGHGREDVVRAAAAQMRMAAYTSYAHFRTTAVEALSRWLIESTGGHMGKVYLMCSGKRQQHVLECASDPFVGSEAVEAALKLSREYFVWKGEPQRVKFIARWESYHGTTVGSLSASGHVVRRGPFEPMLGSHFHKISPCNPYRQRLDGESDATFVARKVAELEGKFQEIGPETVAAVILEPVVGAALGCVPAVPGYLRAMEQVCHKYGALLIFDEVMCGMGRLGSLHAWQQEEVVPDLQTIAKGFGGGYMPASALLVGTRICDVMSKEGKVFTHGHTYQNHPVIAASALKVQQIIQQENLLSNVRAQGKLLERRLKQRLTSHPNVGDIRGHGLFWGIEFVKDKKTKEPFDPALQISGRVYTTAMKDFRVLVYNGQGCAGNGRGDHIMVMPAYNIPSNLVEEIVKRVASAIEKVFAEAEC
ncbi:hypothetical protein OQA88_527 [Cercophora sp. LCS_1]